MTIVMLRGGFAYSSRLARHVLCGVHRPAAPSALIAFHVIHAIVTSYLQPGELIYGRHEAGDR